MDSISKLASLFAEFPGIGSRQSRRFVYFLLKQNKGYINELIRAIESLEGAISQCNRCHRYFTKKYEAAPDRCNICNDETRDHNTLMVSRRIQTSRPLSGAAPTKVHILFSAAFYRYSKRILPRRSVSTTLCALSKLSRWISKK